jgi:hypothetical protein
MLRLARASERKEREMKRKHKLVGLALAGALLTAVGIGVSQAVGGGRPPVPSPDPRLLPAQGQSKVLHVAQTVRGKSWWIKTYTNRFGNYCYDENVPDEGVGSACLPSKQTVFANGRRIYLSVGGRQNEGTPDATRWDTAWLNGFSIPAITKLEVVNADCSRTAVPLDGGVFLAVYGAGQLYSGAWPEQLVGYNAGGRVVSTAKVALAPPDTPAARAAGTQAPAQRACS